jgi:multiple sugar transport system ATP-binding protein
MSNLSLRGIRKSFGQLEIIKGVDLAIESGEFIVFVGPSGCGKSTLLRIISGLEAASAGEVFIEDRNVTQLPPGDRELAMVFQSYALYPHMTVAENMSFSLRMNGVSKEVIAERVGEAARILQINPLMDRKPKQLSGGQRQRVAIGRAIVRKPKVFLFDEPLSNLDAALRLQTRVEIARLHAELGATMIYVTHDQVEAMTLADRIVILNHGKVEQIGAPLELFERPKNKFVAAFLGQPAMNFLEAELTASGGDGTSFRLRAGGKVVKLDETLPVKQGSPVSVGVRPNAFALVDPDQADISGVVEVVEHLGTESVVHFATPGADGLFTAVAAGKTGLRHGSPIHLQLDRSHCHIFDSSGDAVRNAG